MEETIGHHYVMSEDGRIKYNLPLEGNPNWFIWCA